jgi:hypothetical protein
MAIKKQATKEQIIKSAKALLELAKSNGHLDDLCPDGNKAVVQLSELIGLDTEEERTIRIVVTGTVKTNQFDECDNNSDYKVEARYKGKKIANLEIDEASLW